MNIESKAGKDAFDLVDGCTMVDNPEGGVKLAWDRLSQKYKPKTAPSYIQIKQDFENWKLGNNTNDPDEWITLLKSYKMHMNKVKIPGKMDMSEVG